MNSKPEIQKKLEKILCQRTDDLYIALSGGIDSITLMRVAAEIRTAPTFAMHAVSAAVPAEATNRCRELASLYNWRLVQIDAGEFNDSQYVTNPVNRCYYCKSRLFDSIKMQLEGDYCIATGTNTEDLGDYRPGLKAAGERGVWQPYVEAGMDKQGIRNLALQYGLGVLSQLPAQPCLSSRIETGITIDTADLGFVHRLERKLAEKLGDGDIRCRIVSEGVVVQLPADCVVFKSVVQRQSIEELISTYCKKSARQLIRIEPYRMGSAFLRATSAKIHKQS